MAAPTGEIAKPQEVNKPQEAGEKKGAPISAKFQKVKAKFASFSTVIKQAFSKMAAEAPQVVFDAEQHELAQLSEKLAKLNKDTAQALGVPPESATAKPESVPKAIVNTDITEPKQEGVADTTTDVQEPAKTEEVHDMVEAKDPLHRVTKILQELQDRTKSRELEKVFTTKGMLGDSDRIEGHQIDFIYRYGRPLLESSSWIEPIHGSPRERQLATRTVVNFKMTANMTEKFNSEVMTEIPPKQVKSGAYDFQSADGQISCQGEAWVIRVDENTVMYVSKGEKKGYEYKDYDYNKPIKDAEGNIVDYESTTTNGPGKPVRALMGAVRIEVQGLTDVQEIAGKVDTAFQGLKITEALVTPDQQAENQYKEARYRWQHRLEDDGVWQAQKEQYKAEHGTELVEHLERQEVFPEYFTIVDQGASEDYQKDGRIFLTHSICNSDNLVPILKEGLLSSHERFKRGIFTTGMSTEQDFNTGGADSVFIRAVPKSAGDHNVSFYNAHLLINPQVLDRTDWYAYNFDSYGTTDPSTFDSRPSPEQFFAAQRQYFSSGNEIMMRRGIPPEMISGVVVGNKVFKTEIIAKLQTAGIQEVNGVPLDQFVSVHSNFGDLKRANDIESPDPKTPDE